MVWERNDKNNTTPKFRNRFEPSFKQAAEELFRISGKTRKELPAELGIREWNLRDWKQDQDR